MATAIQAVPSTFAVNSPPASAIPPPSAQIAGSSLIAPSVVVTVGAASPLPITYNAAGLFESLVQLADTGQGATDNGGTGLLGTPDTLDQTLAQQLTIALISSATGLDSAAAASAVANTAILQALPPNSTVQSVNNLFATNLGLAAAAQLDSTGTAATTTTTTNGVSITTLASPVTPTSAAVTQSLNGTLLGNIDLSTASTVAVVASSTTGTAAKIGTVSAAVPSVAAVPAAATPVATVSAPVASVPAAAPAAVGNAASTPEVASALADNFLEDFVAESQATIEGNPAYASVAAGLYLSAMVFNAQQSAAAVPPSTYGNVQRVVALANAGAVRAERR